MIERRVRRFKASPAVETRAPAFPPWPAGAARELAAAAAVVAAMAWVV